MYKDEDDEAIISKSTAYIQLCVIVNTVVSWTATHSIRGCRGVQECLAYIGFVIYTPQQESALSVIHVPV